MLQYSVFNSRLFTSYSVCLIYSFLQTIVPLFISVNEDDSIFIEVPPQYSMYNGMFKQDAIKLQKIFLGHIRLFFHK